MNHGAAMEHERRTGIQAASDEGPGRASARTNPIADSHRKSTLASQSWLIAGDTRPQDPIGSTVRSCAASPPTNASLPLAGARYLKTSSWPCRVVSVSYHHSAVAGLSLRSGTASVARSAGAAGVACGAGAARVALVALVASGTGVARGSRITGVACATRRTGIARVAGTAGISSISRISGRPGIAGAAHVSGITSIAGVSRVSRCARGPSGTRATGHGEHQEWCEDEI